VGVEKNDIWLTTVDASYFESEIFNSLKIEERNVSKVYGQS